MRAYRDAQRPMPAVTVARATGLVGFGLKRTKRPISRIDSHCTKQIEGRENVVCCDRQTMADDIRAADSSKDRGFSAARRNSGEALRPTDAEGLARLWDYVKQHGTSQVPSRHRTADGFWLGVWVCARRKNRGEDRALDQLLESLPGWTWAPHERNFEERLAHYKDIAEAGRLNRHRAVREWASKQRQLVRKGEIPADRVEQLRTAGVV
jgi:hypothetical protein